MIRRKLCKLLNTFYYIRDLIRKYDSYLSLLPIFINIYTSMVIRIMRNENEVIYINFFSFNLSFLLIKTLLEKSLQ